MSAWEPDDGDVRLSSDEDFAAEEHDGPPPYGGSPYADALAVEDETYDRFW